MPHPIIHLTILHYHSHNYTIAITALYPSPFYSRASFYLGMDMSEAVLTLIMRLSVDYLILYRRMGPSQSGAKAQEGGEQDALTINHPRFSNLRVVNAPT